MKLLIICSSPAATRRAVAVGRQAASNLAGKRFLTSKPIFVLEREAGKCPLVKTLSPSDQTPSYPHPAEKDEHQNKKQQVAETKLAFQDTWLGKVVQSDQHHNNINRHNMLCYNCKCYNCKCYDINKKPKDEDTDFEWGKGLWSICDETQILKYKLRRRVIEGCGLWETDQHTTEILKFKQRKTDLQIDFKQTSKTIENNHPSVQPLKMAPNTSNLPLKQYADPLSTEMPPSLIQDDPLYTGTAEMSPSDVPPLTSGGAIFAELERRVTMKQNLDRILNAPNSVMDLFARVFPEVVESNYVGRIEDEFFKTWEEKQNDVTLELDTEPQNNAERSFDVYVGGPAAICAAAIQARSKEGSDVLYAHDGQRGISNWTGSASYFHIRDAIPVYYWPDNHGAYTLYATLKHAIQRRWDMKSYLQKVCTDPNWNKLRLSYTSLFKDLGVLGLFAKNQIRAFKDVGLHIKGTVLAPSEETTAYVTTHHAHLSHEILETLKTKRPFFLKSNERAKALHLHLGDQNYGGANEVFQTLCEVADELVEHKQLSEDELQERGYDPKFVSQALEFPLDGYLPPYIGKEFEAMIHEGGGNVQSHLRLKKILVKPSPSSDDATVTKVVWEDTETKKTSVTNVKSLYLSLGPSMRNLNLVLPKNHEIDSIASPSWINYLLPQNILQKQMWASGTSFVFMVKVDKSLFPESHLAKFRDHIDAHNKHIVRLGEKEVVIEGKRFQFFALQTTGGGHFPIKDAHPETALNIFKANVVPLLGLDDAGIEFDVISARSCARGITAANVFRITTPASNMVMLYGIGGIGMTTMAPNALLMKAVLGLRAQLAKGEVLGNEFQRRLMTSDFRSIPHWHAPNPFARNYAQFVDSVKKPKVVARRFGFKEAERKNAKNV